MEQLATTLKRDGPTPHHGHGRAGTDGMGPGELTLHLTWGGQYQQHRLTAQVLPRPTALAHTNFYPICDLMEGKGTGPAE